MPLRVAPPVLVSVVVALGSLRVRVAPLLRVKPPPKLRLLPGVKVASAATVKLALLARLGAVPVSISEPLSVMLEKITEPLIVRVSLPVLLKLPEMVKVCPEATLIVEEPVRLKAVRVVLES